MNENQLAEFLTKAVAIYNDRRSLRLAPELMTDAIRALDAPKVLSVRAIAAIVGAEYHTVVEVIGRDAKRPRGKLNPAHIPTLGYLLSMKKTFGQEVSFMLKDGTSMSMMATLTNISPATLYRWRT